VTEDVAVPCRADCLTFPTRYPTSYMDAQMPGHTVTVGVSALARRRRMTAWSDCQTTSC
jgi:hypothetical protein